MRQTRTKSKGFNCAGLPANPATINNISKYLKAREIRSPLQQVEVVEAVKDNGAGEYVPEVYPSLQTSTSPDSGVFTSSGEWTTGLQRSEQLYYSGDLLPLGCSEDGVNCGETIGIRQTRPSYTDPFVNTEDPYQILSNTSITCSSFKNEYHQQFNELNGHSRMTDHIMQEGVFNEFVCQTNQRDQSQPQLDLMKDIDEFNFMMDNGLI